MTELEKAAKQALEALEKAPANTISQAARIGEAITALRRALAEQPTQTDWEAVAADQAMTIALLKAEQPAQRTWIELDHDDIHALMNEFFYRGMQPSGAHFANFARAIEAKLKEKNT